MCQNPNTSRQSARQSRTDFIIKPATMAVLIALAQPVIAQESDIIEEIVAVGFRSSLINAVNNKRASDAVVESITAEDIGKLADISIAESLARLPGVTAQRTGGQASALNIRGLDQGLILTTLNGREQVAYPKCCTEEVRKDAVHIQKYVFDSHRTVR